MLRVRPGVELVRASFVPTSELMTLDFPTFDLPRKATSRDRRSREMGGIGRRRQEPRENPHTQVCYATMEIGKAANEACYPAVAVDTHPRTLHWPALTIPSTLNENLGRAYDVYR